MTNRLHRVLTEGKHWPEDYIKTGVNFVKASPLGQQSWYSDAYVQQDMKTFADEFRPLSHKNSNLGFFSTIVKWFIAYSGTSKEKYQEFIERKLDGIIGTLAILSDQSYDKVKDEIKQKWTFAQFEELQQKIAAEAKSSSDEKLKSIVKRDDYDLIPIYSYEELNEKFGGKWTGYKGESKWCHTNGKSTYESWTNDGTQLFFVLAKKDWKSIKVPAQKPNKEDNAYDEYGLSLIAILVDVATGNLLNETLRWNHVIDPSYTNPGACVDKAFKNNWGELSQAVGMDVKTECEKECKALKQKLRKEVDAVNKRVAKILRGKTEITKETISARLKKRVTEVNIPSNVTSIGEYTFFDCSNLTSLTIGNNVTSIGNSAFFSCSGLTSVVIPDSVMNIGSEAFASCSNLTSLTIGNNVTSIGSYAFWDCGSLASVKIGDSVTSIGNYAFEDCGKLTSIAIPHGVTSIGLRAFSYCRGLTSMTIPDSVMSIGGDAFYKCDSLKSLVFKGKTLEEVKTMKNYPFGIKDESTIKCERDELMQAKRRKLKSYRRLDNINVDECDGGAVGGDAGGASVGGDAGAIAVDAGDTAGEMAGTSTADVIGTFDPKKGVMGVGNFMVPSKVKVPLHRWEVCNGGSKRKKDKKGRDKKYAYEKGMKVVVDMLEKDGNSGSLTSGKKKIFSRLKRISKGVKSMDDVKAVAAKIEKEKSKIESRFSKSSYSQIKQMFTDFCAFIKDICTGKYKASWFAVTMVTVGLIYIISPIDLIPDVVPVVGVIDDAFVLKLIYDAVKDEIGNWKSQKTVNGN